MALRRTATSRARPSSSNSARPSSRAVRFLACGVARWASPASHWVWRGQGCGGCSNKRLTRCWNLTSSRPDDLQRSSVTTAQRKRGQPHSTPSHHFTQKWLSKHIFDDTIISPWIVTLNRAPESGPLKASRLYASRGLCRKHQRRGDGGSYMPGDGGNSQLGVPRRAQCTYVLYVYIHTLYQ